MSSEQVRMSQNEIQFCFAIATNDEEQASALLPLIKLLPNANLKQDTSKPPFLYCPAIFSLWAISQNDTQTVYRLLAQAFPKEAAQHVPFGVMPTKEEVRLLVEGLVFEPVKKSLLPFLYNVAQLEGSYSNDLERFYLTTSFAALEVLINDPYFSEAPTQQLQLAHKLHQSLQPKVLLAKFDDFLNGGLARVEESKDTPQAVKMLIQSFKQASQPRTFLPSNKLNPGATCKQEFEEERRHITTPRCLLVN